jgi:enediyne biosynthesis thioesterase
VGKGSAEKYFEIRHQVAFEETNLVGNVYFINFLRWQGRCREMFLAQNAPSMVEEFKRGMTIATVHCSCDFFEELLAFELVAIRMFLVYVRQNRLRLRFEYWRLDREGGEQLVARGEMELAFLRRTENGTVPTPLPDEMRDALRPYEA